ncbi:MAG TPA: hypothetical protein VH024_05615 [Candidatus Angelobacter sp.]|jgi:hypothetical protein|nr:hypothetical protein [Candidatus Angelobacter sp.]
MNKYSYTALIFLLVAGGACVAQSDQPTLGELARKHHQQKAPVKMLTNDDVATVTPATQNQSAPAASRSSVVGSTSSSTEGKEAGNAKAAPVTKGAPEVAELKHKLSSYQAEQGGWKQSAKEFEDRLAKETSEFRRQMYQDALEGDKRNVATLQQKIDQTQADLAKTEKANSSGH